jgi:hypothetical protein
MFLAALTAIIALALFIVIFDPSLPSQVLSMIRKMGGNIPTGHSPQFFKGRHGSCLKLPEGMKE